MYSFKYGSQVDAPSTCPPLLIRLETSRLLLPCFDEEVFSVGVGAGVGVGGGVGGVEGPIGAAKVFENKTKNNTNENVNIFDNRSFFIKD